MSLINIFVAGSIVVVVTVFLYFLYQTKRLKNFRRFDYDIDPSQAESDNTYKLICPEDYTYDRTESNNDYCKSNTYNNIVPNKNEISFKTLKQNNEFKYPDLDKKENMSQGIIDRCSKINAVDADLKWDAIQPYCEYSDVRNLNV